MAWREYSGFLWNHDPAACLFRPCDGRLLFGELRKKEIDERPRLRPAGGASEAQAQEEYQRLQHIRIPQPQVAWYFSNMLLLGLAKFPDHGLDLAGDALVRHVGGRRLVDEAGIHQRLIALGQRADSRDQITVQQRAIGAGALRQREAESQDQMLA